MDAIETLNLDTKNGAVKSPLTIDFSPATVLGLPIPTPPDLSDYAKLDAPNVFTQPQTIQGTYGTNRARLILQQTDSSLTPDQQRWIIDNSEQLWFAAKKADGSTWSAPLYLDRGPAGSSGIVNVAGDLNVAGNLNASLPWTSITGHPTTLAGYGITDPVALRNAANTFSLGPQTIQTGADANKGLIVKGNSGSQSGWLADFQNSAGASQVLIGPNGGLAITGTYPYLIVGTGRTGPALVDYGGAEIWGRAFITQTVNTANPILVARASPGVGDIQQWQGSTGTVLSSVSQAGVFTGKGAVPPGGAGGYVLAKNSPGDYDLTWIPPATGGGGGTVTSVGISGANGIGVSGSPITLSGTISLSLPITLAGISGKTLTVNNSLTLAGTDASTLNIGGGGTLGSAAFTPSTNYEVPLTFIDSLYRNGNQISLLGDVAPAGVSASQYYGTNAAGTRGWYNLPTATTTLPWSSITGTPTTLAGYGITDPVVLTTGSYANPSWITSLAWSKITGAPAFEVPLTFQSSVFRNGNIITLLNDAAPASIGNSYYYGTNAAGTRGWFALPSAPATFPWSGITGTPTSLAGYGITDPVALTTGSYADPSWITSLAYSKIAGAPAAVSTVVVGNAGSLFTATPSTPTSGAISIAFTLGMANAKTFWGQSAGTGPATAGFTQVAFTDLAGTPTTLAGYGIASPLPVAQGGTGLTSASPTNKFIISTGSAFALSTPAWPNTTPAANKVLISDGTNWGVSTPAWPNAAATLGNMIVGDGTNWTNSNTPRPTAFPNLTTNGFLKTGSGNGTLSVDTSVYEPGLGNPAANGYILSSTTGGARSWIAPPSGPTTLINSSSIAQTGFAADQYVTGSSINLTPANSWAVTGQYYCVFDMSKTAAGTAASVINVRFGTAGTTSDASIFAWTLPVGTAVADIAVVEIWVDFRTIGTLGQLGAVLRVTTQPSGGLMGTQATFHASSTSGSVNTTTPTFLGVSFNGGTSFSGTCRIAQAEYKQ